jgi:hypothetical protein
VTRVPVKERDFQRTVIQLAQLRGWRVAHFRPARQADGSWRTPVEADGKGFPDLVLVRDRVLFVECKTDTGRLSADQQAWMQAIEKALHLWEERNVRMGDAGLSTYPFDWHVWSPHDWDEIEATLK